MNRIARESRRLRSPQRGDAGFTLIETLVSLAIIGSVMATLSAFFIRGTSTNRWQGDMQAAVRVATDAMEEVRLLEGAALVAGRSQSAVAAQWRAPGVAPYLDPTKTLQVWDDPPVQPAPTLPTAPQRVSVGGTDTVFEQSWYVGQCWKQANGDDCVVVPVAARDGLVALYRVVVAITWRSDACPAHLCSFVTAGLLNARTTDPQFVTT